MFGIVALLVAVDFAFLVPLTVVSSSRLHRVYGEIEGNHVGTSYLTIAMHINIIISYSDFTMA